MTNILFNRLLFVLEIWGTEFIFACHLRKRRYFWLRMAGCVLLSLLAALLLGTPPENAWVVSVTFIALFLLIVALSKLCYGESWKNLFFCGIAAYTVQHCAYEFSNLVLTLITNNASPLLGAYGTEIMEFGGLQWLWNCFYASVYILCCYVVYCGAYFLFAAKIKSENDLKIENLKMLFLVGVGLVVDIFLNAFFVYSGFAAAEDTLPVSLMIYVYNCLCCVLLLMVQSGLALRRKLEDELGTVKVLAQIKAEEYAISKENIDLINQKCHDMKHLIRTIGANKQLPQDVVEEIEQSVHIYDAMVRTGNEALDIILTEKSLRCVAYGITMSCVADGKKISFVKDSDLYALFGNILDNAIEAVLKVEETEKRVIGLVLYERNGFVTLNVNNAYAGDLKLVNGLPVTTKSNHHLHGFGVKSIRLIVEKYGGEMGISTKDGIFSLCILIPVPSEQNSDT